MKSSIAMSLFFGILFAGAAIADDWPMFGRDRTRNSVSPEKNPPTDWAIKGAASKVQRNVKWTAQCGSNSHGFIAVSGGLVWIGSNNEYPRDPAFKGDASVLLCFREADGRFLYQHVSPRLKQGRVNDWPFNGISNAPLIEGDRLWFTTTRCETICLDIAPLLKDTGPAKEVWKLDMIGELGVFPLAEGMGMGRTCSIAASYRDLIYVITGNGVDGSRRDVHSPKAPSLLCLNKNTGKVIWTDNSPGPNILAGQWASPLVVEIGGRGQVVAPQGDGWLRSFDALTGKLIWKFDTNKKDTVWPVDRNSLHASPVYYDGRIYIAGGQEVEHGEGPGHLWCIDPTKEGDISAELGEWGKPGKPNPNSGVVWGFRSAGPEPENTMHRTISSVAIHDGLVIAPDFSGYVHCLDAKTGKHHWAHDVLAAIWSTPLICDGKVYVCDEDGEVCIFELAKEKKLVAEHGFPSAAYCSPVYVNGVLYLASRERLYAIAAPKAPQPPAQPPEEPKRRLPRAAVFVPTPQDVVEKMLEVAGVGKGDVVWDLGSGDGRIVITAAKKYGVKAVGVEIDPQLAKASRESASVAGVGDLVSIRQADLFAQDLAGATVITLYLGERNNGRLIPKLKSLPPGVRIVSYCFPMKGIQPSKVVKFRSAPGDEEHTLYLWTTPLRELDATPSSHIDDWPQHRGRDRSGVSSETGLLKAWPKEGPPLAWKATGMGSGFAGVAIACLGDVVCVASTDGRLIGEVPMVVEIDVAVPDRTVRVRAPRRPQGASRRSHAGRAGDGRPAGLGEAPRVCGVEGRELPPCSWEEFSDVDPLDQRAVEQMVVGVRRRSHALQIFSREPFAVSRARRAGAELKFGIRCTSPQLLQSFQPPTARPPTIRRPGL